MRHSKARSGFLVTTVVAVLVGGGLGLTAPRAVDAAIAPAGTAPTTPQQAPEGYTPFTHWTTDASTGKVTKEISLTPRYHQVGGAWTEIDSSLHARADPTQPISAEGALRPVRLGNDASRLVQLELDGGPVTLSASGLAIGSPQSVSGGVSYANAAGATDLRYLVTDESVKEEIVLRSAQSPQSYSFHLADPKGQLGAVHPQKDGSYTFDARIDGSVGIRLAPPLAYQEPVPAAGIVGSSPAPAVAPPITNDRNSAHMTVAKAGDGFDIALSVDKAWLVGKSFPIVLDPTVVYFNDSDQTMVAATNQNSPSGCGAAP